MTRSEFADFIRRFASGVTNEPEWEQYAIQHYSDIETEQARVRLLRLVQHHGGQSPSGIEAELERIASILLLPVSPASFYYKGGAAGILQESLPLKADSIIAYEPYRSGSHHDMHEDLRSGSHPVCEYMHDGRRYSFTVIGTPAYGRLAVRI